MARDTQKYQYVDVGFLRHSALTSRFLKDAETSTMSEHLGLLVLTRLADYYRMIDNPVQVMTTTMGEQNTRRAETSLQFEEIEAASEAERAANADGAADFFGVL